MFWLPHGFFPYYAEWIISFPRAPLGSVSVVSWQLACTGVISLVADTMVALVRLVRLKGASKQMEEPVKGTSQAGEKEQSKKEL